MSLSDDEIHDLARQAGARYAHSSAGPLLTALEADQVFEFARAIETAALDRESQDKDRLDWLESNVREEPLRPEAFGAEFLPDTRLRYVLPPLVSWTSYSGPISLRRAIDIARADGQAA